MAKGEIRLTFEILGTKEFDRSFSRFDEDVKDLSEAFKEIAGSFHRAEAQQFESSGGFGSGGWIPLASSTVAQKPPGLPILVLSGALRTSLTGGAQSVLEIRPLQMKIGTRVRYGIYHQLGTSRMPPRPPVQMPESVKTEWHKIIHRYLVKRVREVKGVPEWR